jgi:hypothetical protein
MVERMEEYSSGAHYSTETAERSSWQLPIDPGATPRTEVGFATEGQEKHRRLRDALPVGVKYHRKKHSSGLVTASKKH